MRRIHEYGDEGIPFGSVVGEGGELLATPPGGTFSEAGIKRIAHPQRAYCAVYEAPGDDGKQPEVVVRAYDLNAALMCLRHLYTGSFVLWADADPVYLGEFEA